MITITRWAGRHPLFVGIVLLPVLFYIQGHVAFTAGAHLFFDGITLPDAWVWGMSGIFWLTFVLYPTNARTLLHTHYWRIKGLEWVACMVGVCLWGYVGNQMAQQFEGVPVSPSSVSVIEAGVAFSDRIVPETDGTNDNKLKKAYRNYFRAAIKRIKASHNAPKLSVGMNILLVLLCVFGISLGVISIVCGIQCGGAGGGGAVLIIGGLIFVILSLSVLIAAINRAARSRTAPDPGPKNQ